MVDKDFIKHLHMFDTIKFKTHVGDIFIGRLYCIRFGQIAFDFCVDYNNPTALTPKQQLSRGTGVYIKDIEWITYASKNECKIYDAYYDIYADLYGIEYKWLREKNKCYGIFSMK